MSQIRTLLSSIIIGSLAISLSACVTPSNSGSVYKASETQNEQIVRMGTVEAVREVVIDKGEKGVGAASGAILGGIAAGSNIGNGNGSAAAGVVGALLGGIIGQHVEANIGKVKGLEITVRLDNGELRAIIQEADESFKPGDRVRLLSAGQTTRVTR